MPFNFLDENSYAGDTASNPLVAATGNKKKKTSYDFLDQSAYSATPDPVVAAVTEASKPIRHEDKKPENWYLAFSDRLGQLGAELDTGAVKSTGSALSGLYRSTNTLSTGLQKAFGAATIDGPDTPDYGAKLKQLGDEMDKHTGVKEKNYLDHVFEGIGSSIPYLAGGVAGKAIGVSANLMALGLGGMEALTNAYDDYDEMTKNDPNGKNNKTKALASFGANLAVNFVTDRLGFLSEGNAKSVRDAIKKFGIDTLLESGQETAQQAISNLATGKNPTEGLVQTFLVSLPISAPFGAVGLVESGVQGKENKRTEKFLQDLAAAGATKEEAATTISQMAGVDQPTAQANVDYFAKENKDLADTYEANAQKRTDAALAEVSSQFEPLMENLKPEKPADEALFKKKEEDNLPTTKILKDLAGRETVSKQYILDATNRPELKQAERDVIREALKDQGDTVNVSDFTKKVQAELLPLERKGATVEGDLNDTFSSSYENITLPSKIRGPVASYHEHVYESPIKNSAGALHFTRIGTENYFGHTRSEDLPSPKEDIKVTEYFGEYKVIAMIDNEGGAKVLKSFGTKEEAEAYKNSLKDSKDAIRRVIEVQSDLFQKGRLENEIITQSDKAGYEAYDESKGDVAAGKEAGKAKRIELSKLAQYSNPTAHFRMVREEIKKAAEDGKTALQFPTGETAMKIEGLGTGGQTQWRIGNQVQSLTPELLKVGMEVNQGLATNKWIITDVLEDGKFKAVPKKYVGGYKGPSFSPFPEVEIDGKMQPYNDEAVESFDISGKIDTNNPIYRFYEKDLGRYLKNNYGAKLITDEQGVTWYEVPVKAEYATQPVEAFKKNERSDTTISAERGAETIQKYQTRLGIEFPIHLYSKIYTGAMVNGAPEEAFGMYMDNTITLAQAITQFTADHEVGHFVFRNLERIPVFEGMTREELLGEAREKWGDLSKIELEEKIMEGFEQYAAAEEAKKPTTFTGKIKQFFQKLYSTISDLFDLTPEEASSIQKFYDTLYFGKGKGITTFENTGKASAFMEARYKEFGEEQTPSFKKISRKEAEKAYHEIEVDEQIPTASAMPERLANTKMSLDMMKESLDFNPLRNLARYEIKGILPEVTGPMVPGQKGYRKVSEFARRGDEILSEIASEIYGPQESAKNEIGTEQLREAYTEYKKTKALYKEYLADYKERLTEYRDEQRDARALESFLKAQDKRTEAIQKEYDRHQAYTEKVFGKGFQAGEKAGIVVGRKQGANKAQNQITDIKRQNELARLKEAIIKRSYTRTILDALRGDIPRDEWATYMTRLTQVGTSETKFSNLLEAIGERKTELDIEEGSRRDKAIVRQMIGYLKHIYDIEPSLIRSIKSDLNIEGSIKDLGMIELLQFKEELQKRIQFRKENPVRYFDYVKEKEKKGLGKKIKKFDQDFIAPMERKVKQISKPLYESIMSVFYQINANNTTDARNIKPLIEIFNKASKADQILITKYAQSADEERLRTVLEQYAKPEEVDAMLASARESLDRIHKDLTDVGVEVPYRGTFFPRRLKPLTQEQAELMLSTFEYKMGRKATDEERLAIISNLVRGLNPSQLPFITLSGKRFEAHRMIEELPVELMNFYEDFATAIQGYVAGANAVIEQRKFFGKSNVESLDYDANLENSIGMKVMELHKNGIITAEQIAQVRDTLQTLFSYRLTEWQKDLQQFTNDYIYPLALGQITSTLSQAKDLAMQTLMDLFHGQLNLFGKLRITASDINLSESIQELESSVKAGENAVAQTGKKVMTPFGKADSFFLDTFLNASYRRMVKLSKSNNVRFRKELVNIFGEQGAKQLIEDLKTKTGKESGAELPDAVKRWLFSEVAKIRPITKMQKARAAVRHPAIYTLKNFAVKQLEFVRSQSLDLITEGVKTNDKKLVAEGMGKFVAIMAYMALLGAGVDELKDWIMGRNKDTFYDKIVDNTLQVFGYSRYTLDMGSRNGYVMQALYSYLPAYASISGGFIDDLGNDIVNTIEGEPVYNAKVLKRVPLVGNIFYNRFGGGAK